MSPEEEEKYNNIRITLMNRIADVVADFHIELRNGVSYAIVKSKVDMAVKKIIDEVLTGTNSFSDSYAYSLASMAVLSIQRVFEKMNGKYTN